LPVKLLVEAQAATPEEEPRHQAENSAKARPVIRPICVSLSPRSIAIGSARILTICRSMKLKM